MKVTQKTPSSQEIRQRLKSILQDEPVIAAAIFWGEMIALGTGFALGLLVAILAF